MAIEYDLHLSAHMKPAQALEKLASQIHELTWSEDSSFLADTTVQISATDPHTLTQRMFEDAFSFTPTLRIGFRRRLNADWDRLRQRLLDVTLLLLADAQDAVLLFNGETIVLQRLGGHLVFNSEYELGDENWLKSRLTLPFEIRPLPSPLL